MKKYLTLTLRLPLLCLAACILSCSGNAVKATQNPDSLEGKQVYLNPADGKAYQTEAFKTYVPEGGVQPRKQGPVHLKNIILLTDENTLEAVIRIDTLSSYIGSDSAVLASVLKDNKKQAELLIQFTLYAKQQPRINISSDGGLDQATLQQLYDRLMLHSRRYRTLKDSCIYQTQYTTGG